MRPSLSSTSAGQMFEGLDEAIRAMKEAGCDPDHVPADLVALLPKTAKDLVPLEVKAMGLPLENPTEAEDIALVRSFSHFLFSASA